ncbi:uncharacterized protein LOC135394984 isoform X1 [Ornithodoros turicata]|uniref:uncharacterized protein LOC135394984 isoform X1 n=1 Tax=Ornithodoros turicata TaxID=34597 RepID=UPI003139C4B9
MPGNASTSQRILKEVPHAGDITKEDIELYADQLGIVLPDEQDLLWIAQAGLEVSLPPPWCPVEDAQGRIYYFNSVTKETIWEHPLDSYYKDMVKKERRKLAAAKEGSALEKALVDSGTSLMSSLDDVPPLSTFVKPLESNPSVFNPSLCKPDKQNIFTSRSCPADLHVIGTHRSDVVVPKVESQTLKPVKKAPSVKELQSQKETLLYELELLKKAVEKYRFLREQMRASMKQEMSQKSSRTSSEKNAKSPKRTGNGFPEDTVPKVQDGVPKSQVANLCEREKTHFSTLPSRHKRHVSHADLTRISDRLRQLRQRHMQLTMRAAEQVSDEALAGSIVAQAAYHSSLNKEFAPLLKSATASLSRKPARTTEQSSTFDPGLGDTLPYLGKRSSWCSGMSPRQQPDTSHEEWMKRLAELRNGVEECKLKHLLIK